MGNMIRGKGCYEFNLAGTGTLDNENTLIAEGVLTVYNEELGETASHWHLDGRVLRWNEATRDFDPVCLTSVANFAKLVEDHIEREYGISVYLYSKPL